MDQQIATFSKWVDIATAFLVTYSFQILGAIVFFVIGLKVAGWVAGLVVRLGSGTTWTPPSAASGLTLILTRPFAVVPEAIRVIKGVLTRVPQVVKEPTPEAGVQTFSAGDVTIGHRYRAPARAFFPTQFAVNLEARAALAAGLKFA